MGSWKKTGCLEGILEVNWVPTDKKIGDLFTQTLEDSTLQEVHLHPDFTIKKSYAHDHIIEKKSFLPLAGCSLSRAPHCLTIHGVMQKNHV
jgi:hypothetical protein